MRKFFCLFLALIMCLTAAGGLADGILGELENRLEPMEGSDYLFYSQLNNLQGNNRIVYDEEHIYYSYGKSIYCANYDGTDFWEITDTAANNSQIAYANGYIYYIMTVSDSSYLATVKTDGSEIPIRIISWGELAKLLHNYDEYYSFSVSRLYTLKEDPAAIYFGFYSRRYGTGYWSRSGDTLYYGRQEERTGIAKLTLEDHSVSTVFCTTSTRSDNSHRQWPDQRMRSIAALWMTPDMMIHESGKSDGITLRNRVEGSAVVISTTLPNRLELMNNRIYFAERETGKLFTISTTGSQKRKILDGVNEFMLTGNNLLLYSTAEGLYAADENGHNNVLVQEGFTGRFYLMGEWIYYFTETGIERMNLHDGSVETVFDSNWL